MNYPFKKQIKHWLRKQKVRHEIICNLYEIVPLWALVKYYAQVEQIPSQLNYNKHRLVYYILDTASISGVEWWEKQDIVHDAYKSLHMKYADNIAALFNIEFIKNHCKRSTDMRIAVALHRDLENLTWQLINGNHTTVTDYVNTIINNELRTLM